jgi:hypothetical protein
MSLFDDLPHSVTIYGPPTVTADSARGQVITWPTVRASGVPCLIARGSGSESNEFSQTERPRQSHFIAFSDNDGGIEPGDKVVNDTTGETYRFTGDRQQQGVGGIEDFNIISVTEIAPSV